MAGDAGLRHDGRRDHDRPLAVPECSSFRSDLTVSVNADRGFGLFVDKVPDS